MLKKKRSALLVSLALTFSVPTHSTGFPTVDVANLLAKVTEYATILKEYDQILKQTGIGSQELILAIQQYEQTLREYESYLNQVRALEDKIDRRDYPAIERELRRLYKQNSGDLTTSNHRLAEQRYGRLPSKNEYDQLSKSALGRTPEALERQYLNAGQSHRQSESASLYQDRQHSLYQQSEQLDSQRGSLGKESQLATLQMIVEQNQLLIEQMNLQNDLTISRYVSSNQLDARVASGLLKSQQAQLERIKEARGRTIVLDERPIR